MSDLPGRAKTLERAVQAVCNAMEVHLRCDYPRCECQLGKRGIPAALDSLTLPDLFAEIKRRGAIVNRSMYGMVLVENITTADAEYLWLGIEAQQEDTAE